MPKEKKNQHYVPRGYLENWAIPDKYQVYVYNKKQKKSYPASIYDIASERYFYDIDFTGILSEENFKRMGLKNCDPAHIDDGQYIENFFAEQIENGFIAQTKTLITRIANMSVWEKANCYFISEFDKFNFSFFLALQFIRVKSVRSSIAELNDCLTQVLTDMGASQETIDKYTVPESHLPYIHGKMILDKKEMLDLTNSFFSLSWILLENKTHLPLFTSDTPIGTKEHIHHPFMSMRGIKSKGVEVFFPLSPNVLLVMFDGDYHTQLASKDRYVDELIDEREIHYYNSILVSECDSCVFSQTNDFTVIENMLAKDPHALDHPHSITHWGGKTYFPRKK